jgi:hypothetical protein
MPIARVRERLFAYTPGGILRRRRAGLERRMPAAFFLFIVG